MTRLDWDGCVWITSKETLGRWTDGKKEMATKYINGIVTTMRKATRFHDFSMSKYLSPSKRVKEGKGNQCSLVL